MIHIIWNAGVAIFLIGVAIILIGVAIILIGVAIFLIGVTMFLIMWYLCVISFFKHVRYFHFCLSKQQESAVANTIPSATETASDPSASTETEKMSPSLAIETPPVTDDDMSTCTKVSCHV